jgi:hypothetical protein
MYLASLQCLSVMSTVASWPVHIIKYAMAKPNNSMHSLALGAWLSFFGCTFLTMHLAKILFVGRNLKHALSHTLMGLSRLVQVADQVYNLGLFVCFPIVSMALALCG